MVRSVDKINTSANSEVLQSTITGYSQYQWHNYNFCPTPPANIRYTVLIHNSGYFGPSLPFWAPGPPDINGAADGYSYVTARYTNSQYEYLT